MEINDFIIHYSIVGYVLYHLDEGIKCLWSFEVSIGHALHVKMDLSCYLVGI